MAQRRNILSLLARVDPDIAENVRLVAVPGGFVNLTGLTVGDQVAALLSYGPRFLRPEDVSIPGVMSQIGEIHMQVERHIGLGITGPIFVELLNQYKEEKDELFALRQPSMMEVALRQAVIETKEFFRLYTHACIVQSDKGNKTCLMLLADYQVKMDAYIQKCIAKGVYRLTTENRVNAAVNIFRGLREDILACPLPSDAVALSQLCDRLRQFKDARLPSLYGNVKCHKPDTPIRPICSTVAWYSRPIQKILYHVLRSYFSGALCRQNVLRINDVAKEIAAITPRPNYVFVKLDVTDMYGSMDKRRIFMLLDRLLDQIENEGLSVLPKNVVKRMLRYSLRQSCLVGYQDKVYEQLMGLPQGACDSGFLATIYLDYVLQLHHEELFVAHRVSYWAKYMDDFLLYLPARNISFFKQRIEHLTGLAFEIEPEEEVTEGVYFNRGVIRTIPFLDLNIHTVPGGNYLISSYRKPTASQRMIHALSNTIYSYKVNTMRAFLKNLFRRTSTEFLEHDLNMLYERILMNGYSHNFVECIYYKAITDEELILQQEITSKRGNEVLSRQKISTQIDALENRLRLLRKYKGQFSLDLNHHYQTIRDEHVHVSKQPGYRFPYRSVRLSRLVFAACQYANMPPPVYCRADDSDVFHKFLGHKRIQEAMRANDDSADNGRRVFSAGLLRCITCGTIFVVSGRERLSIVVEQEFATKSSEIYKHQIQFQHTISPVIQMLRPVAGVDTAYLCQLYLAIYQTMGLSTSDRFSLSSLPSFIRTMLNVLQGAIIPQSTDHYREPNASTWLAEVVPYLSRPNDEEDLSTWGSGDTISENVCPNERGESTPMQLATNSPCIQGNDQRGQRENEQQGQQETTQEQPREMESVQPHTSAQTTSLQEEGEPCELMSVQLQADSSPIVQLHITISSSICVQEAEHHEPTPTINEEEPTPPITEEEPINEEEPTPPITEDEPIVPEDSELPGEVQANAPESPVDVLSRSIIPIPECILNNIIGEVVVQTSTPESSANVSSRSIIPIPDHVLNNNMREELTEQEIFEATYADEVSPLSFHYGEEESDASTFFESDVDEENEIDNDETQHSVVSISSGSSGADDVLEMLAVLGAAELHSEAMFNEVYNAMGLGRGLGIPASPVPVPTTDLCSLTRPFLIRVKRVRTEEAGNQNKQARLT